MNDNPILLNPNFHLGKLDEGLNRLSDELAAWYELYDAADNAKLQHAFALVAAQYERLEESLKRFQPAILEQLLREIAEDQTRSVQSGYCTSCGSAIVDGNHNCTLKELINRSPEAQRRCAENAQ